MDINYFSETATIACSCGYFYSMPIRHSEGEEVFKCKAGDEVPKDNLAIYWCKCGIIYYGMIAPENCIIIREES